MTYNNIRLKFRTGFGGIGPIDPHILRFVLRTSIKAGVS